MSRTCTCLALVAGIAILGLPLGSVGTGRAQSGAPPQRTGVIGSTVDGEGRGPLRAGELGNYDYFTARQRADLGGYLTMVTNRHASESVWALFWAGKYEEPQGDCEYVLARFPNHPRALHLIGEIAKAKNDVSLAIPYFENALRLYPQYAFTHAQYGDYLIGIGLYAAGVGQLREALRIDPKQFQAKAWLTEALAKHPELKGAGAAP